MESAGRLIGKTKLTRDLADPEARACAAWKAAAGKKIAEHSRAVGLVRGKLVVEVEDYLWQKNLNTLRHFLVKNLTKEMGEEIVTDLDLRPMPRKILPQGATRLRRVDEGDAIADPVMRGLYKEARKKA